MNFIQNNADTISGGIFGVVVSILVIVAFMIFDSKKQDDDFT